MTLNPIIISTQDLCELWALSAQTIGRYVSDGMPKHGAGQFDLNRCWAWRLEQMKTKVDFHGEKLDYMAERAGLTKAQRQEKEIDVSLRKGEIMTLDEVKRIWGGLLLAFKQKILILPTKLPSRLAACQNQNEIKQLLDDECREALRELSEMDARSFVTAAKARKTDSSSLKR